MTPRYAAPDPRKRWGRHDTPAPLAAFVAEAMAQQWTPVDSAETVRVLDPAAGHGVLLDALAEALAPAPLTLHGLDTDGDALAAARQRLRRRHSHCRISLRQRDFLDRVRDAADYDLVIANPPYVRTQALGAARSGALAARHRLTGRVDLHHAFLASLAQVLRPGGWAGIIVPNRLLHVRAGQSLRDRLDESFHWRALWDLGDTRLFSAAVLPAVLLLQRRGRSSRSGRTRFRSIYTAAPHPQARQSPDALSAIGGRAGPVVLADGRHVRVRSGTLRRDPDGGVWRLSTPAGERWLKQVHAQTHLTFGDLGPVRVGVKTTADDVFVRTDWHCLPGGEPELLRPLLSHHDAAPYCARSPRPARRILYPHEVTPQGRRAVSLADHPNTARYLEPHRERLSARTYLRRAGRRWYELWVPQDPAAWAQPKLVWPDIAPRPTFWVDRSGAVVQGDCYWLAPRAAPRRLLWLALAVGNSDVCQTYYDLRFGNRLYGGRRRFMTQYVSRFPLPDPSTDAARRLAHRTRRLHRRGGTPSPRVQAGLEGLVRQCFGLGPTDPREL